jgi:hypothetical protein
MVSLRQTAGILLGAACALRFHAASRCAREPVIPTAGRLAKTLFQLRVPDFPVGRVVSP